MCARISGSLIGRKFAQMVLVVVTVEEITFFNQWKYL